MVKRRKRERKPGPKSFQEKAVIPRNAGRKMRGVLRFNEFASAHAMQSYRTGYATMWKHAAEYMTKKKLPRPGKFKKNNHHAGKLWALPAECKLTETQAARILEICFDAGLSEAALRQVKKSLSYAHFLRTGIVSRNWKEVKNTWATFLGNFGEVVQPTMPEHVPTPEQLKHAFMRPWSEETGMPLTVWSVGLVAAWDWAVAGLRSKTDMDKVKTSTDHDVNGVQGYCSTGFVDGRSKLCGRKRGSRAWRVWRVCLCDQGKHRNVPEDVLIDKAGNPEEEVTWTTYCPVACVQLTLILKKSKPRVYPKWLKSGSYRSHNVKDPVELANQWFGVQQTDRAEPFSTNSGRKSLARWLSRTKTIYEQGFQIHGDLFAVWSESYQPDCENPTGFDRRTQSNSPDHCLEAYKKLRKLFGVKVPSQKPLNRQEKLMLLVAQGLGKGAEAQKLIDED